MAKIVLDRQQLMNRKVSHIDGVRDTLHKRAKKISSRAESLHAEYHDSTDKHETEFSVTQGSVDSFANMDHPAVIPIEFGWVHPKSGKITAGKHTMVRAAGLL